MKHLYLFLLAVSFFHSNEGRAADATREGEAEVSPRTAAAAAGGTPKAAEGRAAPETAPQALIFPPYLKAIEGHPGAADLVKELGLAWRTRAQRESPEAKEIDKITAALSSGQLRGCSYMSFIRWVVGSAACSPGKTRPASQRLFRALSGLEKVLHFRMEGCGLTPADAAILLPALRGPSTKEYDLRGRPTGRKFHGKLVVLDLSENGLQNGGLRYFPPLPLLRGLHLRDVGLVLHKDSSTRFLTGLKRCPKLRVLDLSENDLGGTELAELAAHLPSGLQRLLLENGGMGAAALTGLRSILAMEHLEELSLFGNPGLADIVTEIVEAALASPSLTCLDLGGCAVTPDKAAALQALVAGKEGDDDGEDGAGEKSKAFLLKLDS